MKSLTRTYKDIDGKENELRFKVTEETDFSLFLTKFTQLISHLNESLVYLREVSKDMTSNIKTLSRIEDKIDVINKNTYKEVKIVDEEKKFQAVKNLRKEVSEREEEPTR